ncbi:MAG: hypothetical protein U0R50_11615 [Gaiellales bacterium]
MKLVDQWTALERRLPSSWETVTIRVRPEQADDLGRAAQLLGSVGAGRVGDELALTVVRRGGLNGPAAARRAFGRLDERRVWCELEQVSAPSETTPVSPPEDGSTLPAGETPLAAAWDRLLALLPPDWGVLLCRLDVDSSDLLPRVALLGAPLNPTRAGDDLAFTFRCGKTSGYGVSPAMARRCFERIDEDGIAGRVSLLRLLSEMDNVGTQGTSWIIAGRVS